jgi:hypothetical protein
MSLCLRYVQYKAISCWFFYQIFPSNESSYRIPFMNGLKYTSWDLPFKILELILEIEQLPRAVFAQVGRVIPQGTPMGSDPPDPIPGPP